MVTPDTVFSLPREEKHTQGDVLVFHPLNYSYLAYEDPFVAHERNVEWIRAKIELNAREAALKLDRMVDEMNRQYEPKLITFLYGVNVTENEDGSFSFEAHGGGPTDYEKVLASEYLDSYL